MTRLEHKHAFVTGAARGIGSGIAHRLAADGAAVAVCDIDATAAEATAQQVAAAHGVPAIAVVGDVTDRSAVVTAVDAAERALGPVDVLVNNAGIEIVKRFVDSTEEDWDAIIAVNLRGTLIACHVLIPRMATRGGGVIVNIASDAGRVGSSGEAVYSATKGGVIAFTKTLARETVRDGIRVNCVSPGLTETALLDRIRADNPKLVETLVRGIPMRRVATPDDVASVVVFLASDEAGYVTGQTISVSGGLTMV